MDEYQSNRLFNRRLDRYSSIHAQSLSGIRSRSACIENAIELNWVTVGRLQLRFGQLSHGYSN